MKQIIAFFSIAFLFSSCEKEIEIDLNSTDPQVVIEGNITDAPGPYYVTITKTVNFSDPNNYPAITGAFVIITDNLGTKDTLTETTPGKYRTNTIRGIPGNTYSLSVTAEQKNYTATSTMPLKVSLDSLKFTRSSIPGGDDTYFILPVFTDPSTFGNNYRFLLSVNGELDKSFIVDNDLIGNGLVNKRQIFSSDLEIKLGDTVSVEMLCLDLSSYTYFYTLSQIAGGGPGGGTTPTNPPNNITGNKSLGIFSAYTTQSRVQIVK